MRKAAVLIAALALASGCSSSTGTSAEGSASISPKPSSTPAADLPVVATYLKGIANQTTKNVQAAVEASAPGSVAWRYAQYTKESNEAYVAGGDDPNSGKSSLARVGAGWKMCDGGKKPTCATYTDFVIANGKVSDYKLDGKSRSKRLHRLADRKPVRFGVLGTIRILTAYQTDAGDVAITLKCRNTSSWKWTFSDQSAYVAPSGKQSAFTQEGPNELLPGANGYFFLFVDNARLGGKLYLDLFSSDSGAPLGTNVMISTA